MKKESFGKTGKLQSALSRHRQGFIIGILTLVIVMVLAASYGIMEFMERRAHSAAEKLVSEVVATIDGKMNEVRDVTRAAIPTAYENLKDPDALERLVMNFVTENDFVYGSTVAFEPNAFPDRGRCFAPYSWRTSDGLVHLRQLGTETDYYEEEWYAETKRSGKEYWCEPYFDEGGAKIMMCTFSVPIIGLNNKLQAIMTADVGLEDLEAYISSISPYPDSYIVLRSRNGSPLVNAELDSTIGNGTTIIKGMTEIGWSVELMLPFTYLMHGDTGILFFIGSIVLLTILLVYAINQVLTRLQKRASEEYMNVIDAISSSYSSIHLINLQTNETVVYRDPAAYSKVVGEGKDEPAGFTEKMTRLIAYDCYGPDRNRMLWEVTTEAIRNKLTGQDRYEVRFRKENGDDTLWYEMHVFALERDEKKTPVRAVVAFADVNKSVLKEKEAQETLEQALEMAESSSRAKTAFLNNMSHDIRTPMNAITGFTSMAKKYSGDREKVEEYLDKIDTSGQQLLALINQVLEMARIESGKIEIEAVPVNVREEYNAMITVLSEQTRNKGLEFNHSLEDVVHEDILADKARMSSITLNLAGNAIKYTPEGGRIDYILKEIPARKEGWATYVFSIIDTGIGMSPEYIKVLFEPFTREKSSTVSGIQGTGLGLSIVKNLVDLMGGTIDVSSESGKGTRFDITIDFKINHQQEEDEDSIDMSGIQLEGRRVLLVEDNELNREIAVDLLEEKGLITEDADDGIVAVQMLERKGPDYYDFILMDIQMPIMNGYEATRAIREMYPDKHIPIIALSANAFAEDKAASLAAGMDDHVAKPVNINELFGALSKLL